MATRQATLALALLLPFTTAFGVCRAQDVAYETLYDHEGLKFVIPSETNRQVRYVFLHGQLGEAGMVQLDGNLCNVDQFGERETCTSIYFRPFEVKLPLLATKGHWKLYGIVPRGSRIANYTMRLAVRTGGESTANLLLNSAIDPDTILETRLMRRVNTVSGYKDSLNKLLAKEPKRESETHTVEMSGLSFSRRILRIKAGDRVVWKCASGRHNAERTEAPGFCTEPADRDCTDCADPECLLRVGEESKPITFQQKGSFDYFCRPHRTLGMTGTIIVE